MGWGLIIFVVMGKRGTWPERDLKVIRRGMTGRPQSTVVCVTFLNALGVAYMAGLLNCRSVRRNLQ